MREVPVVLFGCLVRSLQRAGVDTGPHLAAVGLDQIELQDIRERVDWDRAATFLNDCTRAAGLDERAQEQLGELFVNENPYLQMLARIALSPMLVQRVSWRVVALVYPHLAIEHERVGERDLTARIVVPEPYVACAPLMWITAGACRSASRLLGLGDSEVHAEVTLREAHYAIRVPATKRLRVDSEADDADSVERVVVDFQSLVGHALGMPAPRARYSLKMLQQQLGLTRAEARVAWRVADGLRPHEIAHDLHISLETVRTHLKHTYVKTNTRRQVELALLVRGQREDLLRPA